MCEDRQKTSKAGSRQSTSSRKPAKTTRPSRPSACAGIRRRPSSSPWPTITNRASGTRAITRAAAASRVAWSLCAVRAATLPTTGAPAGTPRARNASAPAPAGARSGTPSYTTRTRAGGRPPFSSTRATAALTAITRRQRRYFQRERGPRSAKSTRREAISPRGGMPIHTAAAAACGSCTWTTSARKRRTSCRRANTGPGTKSPPKPTSHTSRSAARARSRRADPARQATITSCPRRSMPLAVSSTWFCPPRQPRALSTCTILTSGAGRRRRAARGAWPASRTCSTSSGRKR